MIAWGYPVSACWRTASCTSLASCGLGVPPRALLKVKELPTSL